MTAVIPVKDIKGNQLFVAVNQIRYFYDVTASSTSKGELTPTHMALYLMGTEEPLKINEPSIEFIKRAKQYSNVMAYAQTGNL